MYNTFTTELIANDTNSVNIALYIAINGLFKADEKSIHINYNNFYDLDNVEYVVYLKYDYDINASLNYLDGYNLSYETYDFFNHQIGKGIIIW